MSANMCWHPQFRLLTFQDANKNIELYAVGGTGWLTSSQHILTYKSTLKKLSSGLNK